MSLHVQDSSWNTVSHLPSFHSPSLSPCASAAQGPVYVTLSLPLQIVKWCIIFSSSNVDAAIVNLGRQDAFSAAALYQASQQSFLEEGTSKSDKMQVKLSWGSNKLTATYLPDIDVRAGAFLRVRPITFCWAWFFSFGLWMHSRAVSRTWRWILEPIWTCKQPRFHIATRRSILLWYVQMLVQC